MFLLQAREDDRKVLTEAAQEQSLWSKSDEGLMNICSAKELVKQRWRVKKKVQKFGHIGIGQIINKNL